MQDRTRVRIDLGFTVNVKVSHFVHLGIYYGDYTARHFMLENENSSFHEPVCKSDAEYLHRRDLFSERDAYTSSDVYVQYTSVCMYMYIYTSDDRLISLN